MAYTEESIKHLNEKYLDLETQLNEFYKDTFHLLEKLKSEKVKEYLSHGVLRRLAQIQHCIGRIFSIFPPERTQILSRDERYDLVSYLHAYAINLAGLLDNWAWVYVYEKGLYSESDKKKLGRHDVAFFKEKFVSNLPPDLSEFINSENIKKWNKDYLRPYRDSLAHRIPLYVPSKILTDEQVRDIERIKREIDELLPGVPASIPKIEELKAEMEMIGVPSLAMNGSFSEEGFNKGILFHAQIIADIEMVLHISEKFKTQLTHE